ncbi:MAG: hypothetical protein HYY93_16155 [Planctomycetes bacterium]|nr:hypothetical protein [Planctomycetota bacterium]
MARIIKAADSTESHAFAMDLADVAIDAKRLLDAARAQAAQILSAARAQTEKEKAQGFESGRGEGYRAGYAAGAAEGRAVAEREAREAAQAQIQSVVTTLTLLVNAIEGRKHTLVDGARRDLIDLATRIAGVVVGREISKSPQAVQSLVTRAVELAASKSDLELRVHPDDVAAVEGLCPDLARRWRDFKVTRVIGDPAVGRGGCIVRTPDGEIDAQVATVFEEICRALLAE